MTEQRKVEVNETAFFDTHYAATSANALGWRLRMERELRSVLQAADGRRLRNVLSIGCGDGAFELLLAPHVDRIVAIDISQTAIDLGRRGAANAGRTNIEFRCQSAAALPSDERFDAIVCIAFLHHIPENELQDFLLRCADHLTPGGLMYSQDPNIGGILRAVGRVVMGRNKYAAYHSPDERELDPREVVELYRRAGFARIDVGYIDFTLIPASYILARGPSWLLRIAAAVDRLLCASPGRNRASGFCIAARMDS